MQTVTINIDKESIANAVYRLTANAEVERGDDAHVATEDNSSLVMGFIDDAVHILSDAVNMYGYAIANTDEVSVELYMPSHWGGKTEVTKDSIRVYLENYTVARWFELSGTADRFNNAANTALMSLKKVLDNRQKPTR